jgi:hypothetical protein
MAKLSDGFLFIITQKFLREVDPVCPIYRLVGRLMQMLVVMTLERFSQLQQ